MKKKFKMHNIYADNLINNFIKYYADPSESFINTNFNWFLDHVCVVEKEKDNSITVVSNDLSKANSEMINSITTDKNKISWINFTNNQNNKYHNLLSDSGFEFLYTYPAMALDLNKWEIKDYLDNKQIKEVENQKEIDIFTNIIENSFDLETIVLEKYLPIHQYNLKNNVGHMILIKDENNQYVGTGMVYFDDTNAVIDDIAVLESARGKGYAKMIMFYLISYVKKLNKQNVLLFGTKDAVGIYSKIGFSMIDTYMEVFYKK